jgi:DNA-binding SARP family transcriptional activator
VRWTWWGRVSGAGWATSVAFLLVFLFLTIVDQSRESPAVFAALIALLNGLPWLALATAGTLVVVHRRENPIGWLLLATGALVLAMSGAAQFVSRPGPPLGAPALAGLMDSFGWVAMLALVSLVLLLFPTGRPPSSRWRVAVWLIAISGMTLGAALLVTPGPVASFPHIENPFGVASLADPARWLGDAARMAFFLGFWAAMASVAARFWWSEGIERQQLKWFAFGVAVMIVAFLLGEVAHRFGLEQSLFNSIALMALPPAVVVAMLRYRLWDLDLIVHRAITYGTLVVFITLVYVAFVVGIGWLAGVGIGGDLLLVLLATAVAAVLLQPAREAAQATARRLVFGIGRSDDEADAPGLVAIRTLGMFRVERDGEPIGRREWQSKKARQLLKMLIARRGWPVHREELIEHLWPDETGKNLGNRLAVAVSTVRSVLDPEKSHPADHYVVGDEDTLRLDLRHVDVDVEWFLATARRALRDGGSATPEALATYRGDFLPEDLYEDWANPLREEARAAYLALLKSRAECAATVEETVSAHLRVLENDPWDETSHQALIKALADAGRHGEARRAARRYRSRMAEIGVTPEHE